METYKIAFFSWESLHGVRVGGLSPAATHLAENLAERGHEVHFFTRAPPHTAGEGQNIGSHLINRVWYHFLQPSGANIVEYCHTLSLLALDAFHRLDSPPFDLLHFHDWHYIDALSTLSARNCALSFHSTEYGRNGGTFGDWWEFNEISKKEDLGAALAKNITTLSQETKTEVMWLYHVPEEKISLIPNGTNPEHFRRIVDPGAVKKKYGIHPLAPLVLFVGRLVYQKGPDLLIQAVPLILDKRWDVQFILAGDGVMRSYLEDMARTLPVRFLGYVADSIHLELLNAADIVVIPSRNEPFGLVLTEAWSAERCVVATDVGGLSENIENFIDGVKVPVRHDTIAWGINYLIDDPIRILEMGRAGRRKVIRHFSWDRITELVMDVYREMLATPHKVPPGRLAGSVPRGGGENL